MIVQTTIQLLLGNVILFVVGLACLYFLNQVPKQKFVKFNQARVMLGVTSIFYLFCLAIIIKLLVH
jgi:undecaprenyl pyrophosphate phosphatase UppP